MRPEPGSQRPTVQSTAHCAAWHALPCSRCPFLTLWLQLLPILHLLSCADESAKPARTLASGVKILRLEFGSSRIWQSRPDLPWRHTGTYQENICRSLLLSERQQLGSQLFRLLFEFEHERIPVRRHMSHEKFDVQSGSKSYLASGWITHFALPARADFHAGQTMLDCHSFRQ